MSDARWGDPREYGDRDHGDERPRVYDERDRDDLDPRDGLTHDLDLPRGEERELVVDRDRVYELNGEDSRTLAAVGTFRVVPEQDLDRLHELRRSGGPQECQDRLRASESAQSFARRTVRDRLGETGRDHPVQGDVSARARSGDGQPGARRASRGDQLGTIPGPAAALDNAVPSFRGEHQSPRGNETRSAHPSR